MPLDKFVLILVIVIGAAGLTVWVATLASAALQMQVGWLVLVPAALIFYVGFRVVADRLSNKDDDHYDGIEK